MKILGWLCLMIGISAFASAVPPAPEIDPGSAGSVIAIVVGALLIYRGRR